jgi:hypothetical protein
LARKLSNNLPAGAPDQGHLDEEYP